MNDDVGIRGDVAARQYARREINEVAFAREHVAGLRRPYGTACGNTWASSVSYSAPYGPNRSHWTFV